MIIDEAVAGRRYGRVYRVLHREDLRDFLASAVRRSGGTVLFASQSDRAPLFLGVQTPREERIGILVYPFRATHRTIRNRPADEHRVQLRYGAEATWEQDHPLGRDLAGVDTTVVLGVHLEADLLMGLDPDLYDPLPMGISVEFKAHQVDAAQRNGWHVFERDNHSGTRRANPRAPNGLETIVLFTPERLLDYIRLERKALDLALDPPLRFAAAAAAASPSAPDATAVASIHALEQEFDLNGSEILDIIANRNRLAVAVRGGVAEHHLERVLRSDPAVVSVLRLDADGEPDFEVRMRNGRQLRVECKNASPGRFQAGSFKVEVQKTRASKGDEASRFYPVSHFEVVAACLYSPTRAWTFRYQLTSRLAAHSQYPDRIAAIQRIDESWAQELVALLE